VASAEQGVAPAIRAQPLDRGGLRADPRLVLAFLLATLALAIVLGAAVGSVAISPLSIAEMALNRLGLGHFAVTWRPQDEVIFFELRLPRVLGAALVGLGLATAGVLFQGLLRNPLADPFVMGTSGGASLGAIVGLVIGTPLHLLGFGIVQLTAFAGALAAVALVYQIARVGGRTPVITLLLAGFAVSAIFGYAGSFLLIVNDRLQLSLPRIYSWLLGGVAVDSWSQLAIAGPLALLAALAASGLARSLNALSLGEDGASRLGVAVARDARLVIITGSLLTATAVSVSGLIGFVGLVVPHVVRLLWGPNHRLLLPAAGLAGAIFVVLADLAGRSLLPPTEIPVGILTAFIGGPYFLYLLRRTRRDYRW